MEAGNIMAEAPSNEMEMLRKMEDEHLRLQRQVRVIQTDREHRSSGVHPMFRRQEELMKVLKKEYDNHLKDLRIARSGAHKKKDSKMKRDLKHALLIMTQRENDCKGGVSIMNQLDGVLQRNTKTIMNLRALAVQNKGRVKQRQYQSENRLVSTENQLEKAMLRFNSVQGENRKIREEIEHILKERAIFNQEWTKMLNALKKGKKFLSDLFESSTVGYDQRDEWCMKLRSVQEKGKMDQKLQIQEMKDLQKMFDHDMKLYNFLYKKGRIRINNKQKEREEKKKREEEELRKKELDVHRKILDDITDYTQETSPDKIIEAFKKREHDNMSIYKLVTEFCAEIEMLTRDLKTIRRNVNDRRDWNEMMEDRRQSRIEELKRSLEETKERKEKLQERLNDRIYLLNTIMERVTELFEMLECSMEPFLNLLGDKQPSLNQLPLTLCLMTEKIKELVYATYYYEHCLSKREKGISSTSRLKKYTVHVEPVGYWTPIPINILVPADPCPSCVEARWLSRVSEAPEVPFDKQMTLAAMEKVIEDPAYERSDRIHTLSDCRLPHSRSVLARRYL